MITTSGQSASGIEMVFQEIAAKFVIGFSSCIKDFENAAFSHSTAVPNKYAILFKNTFFVIYKNFSW